MSVMLYPCTLCVACLTVFVNCLVKQFAMCLGVVAILLLNVMDVFSVCGGALLDFNQVRSSSLNLVYLLEDQLKNYLK